MMIVEKSSFEKRTFIYIKSKNTTSTQIVINQLFKIQHTNKRTNKNKIITNKITTVDKKVQF